MPDIGTQQRSPGRFNFLRVPLFRLLAINLAAGTAVAVLFVGGLLALNPVEPARPDLCRLLARHRARAAAVRLRRDLRLDRDGDGDHGDGTTRRWMTMELARPAAAGGAAGARWFETRGVAALLTMRD